jgi:hypothetical protein
MTHLLHEGSICKELKATLLAKLGDRVEILALIIGTLVPNGRFWKVWIFTHPIGVQGPGQHFVVDMGRRKFSKRDFLLAATLSERNHRDRLECEQYFQVGEGVRVCGFKSLLRCGCAELFKEFIIVLV